MHTLCLARHGVVTSVSQAVCLSMPAQVVSCCHQIVLHGSCSTQTDAGSCCMLVSPYLAILDAVLDVDEAHHFEFTCQLRCPVPDDVQALLGDGLWGNATCRVTCTQTGVVQIRRHCTRCHSNITACYKIAMQQTMTMAGSCCWSHKS